MRKLFFISLVVTLLMFPLIGMCGEELPRRQAVEVDDVFSPYMGEWMVSSKEEQIGDQKVSNAPECDIKGIISCYDNEYFRVDILLNNPVSYQWEVWYGIVLEYTNVTEYYAYCPTSKQFMYTTEVDGVSSEKFDLEPSDKHMAGVTKSSDADNSDIYFILNKAEHLVGEKGNRYYVTAYFFSGFIDEEGELQLADETIPIDLEFTM